MGKHLYNALPLQNSLRTVDVLSLLLFNFASKHAIRTSQENQECLKLNGTTQFLVNADDIRLLDESMNITTKKGSLSGALAGRMA
jgi:hypothetical protein